MPLYNFKARFVEMVIDGRKRTTIRRRRKDGRAPKPGSTAYCYFGARTKHCRKLREAPIVAVDGIRLDALGCCGLGVTVRGVRLATDAAEALAKADGFPSLLHMREFFEAEYGLPLCDALLITWGVE